MISTKVTTQSWSKAPQMSGLKGDKNNYDPATKESGDSNKSIGDRLNEIANPGGKDPLKQRREVNNELGKDAFLKLMLTQMKHQDPMNPLKSHEMAAQLAQFTSLEQLFNVNKNLEAIGKGQKPLQKFEVLNFIGKTIKADSRDVIRIEGDDKSELRFDLKGDATSVKVTISDAQGETVRVIETGSLKKGANKIVWNGVDKDDRDVRPGRYNFSVEAQNGSGNRVGVATETKGTITGVNYTAEGPVLMIGDQKVRLKDVQRIEDDKLRGQLDNKEKATAAGDLGAKPKTAPQPAKPKLGGATMAVSADTSGNGRLKVGGAFGSK